jgi:hypothetical protein
MRTGRSPNLASTHSRAGSSNAAQYDGVLRKIPRTVFALNGTPVQRHFCLLEQLRIRHKYAPGHSFSNRCGRSALSSLFVTNPVPPASRAAAMNCTSAVIKSMSTLKNTMAAWHPAPRTRLATSRPLKPGMAMSNTTTSGVVVVRIASAEWPSVTAPTISKLGLRISRQSARISGVSSTSRTRGSFKKAPQEWLDCLL